jgi:hypothetical protein
MLLEGKRTTMPHRQYEAIVYKTPEPSPDFTSSEAVLLPGQHVGPQAAWQAVFAQLRGPAGRRYVGGAIRAVPAAH